MLVHRALVYDSPAQLAATVAPFLSEGLERGDELLVATRRECHAPLRSALGELAGRVGVEDAGVWQTRPAARLVALRRMADALRAGAELRAVHEPLWDGSAESVREWVRFEAIVNAIFAELPLRLVCVYARSSLSPKVLEHARRTHPELLEDGGVRINPEYRAPELYLGPRRPRRT